MDGWIAYFCFGLEANSDVLKGREFLSSIGMFVCHLVVYLMSIVASSIEVTPSTTVSGSRCAAGIFSVGCEARWH